MKETAASVSFRHADETDLNALIELLYDDKLGSLREDKDRDSFAAYSNAFRQIQSSPENTIFVAEMASEIVGMFQLTLIPGLSHQGSQRGQIENVRVKNTFRGKGIGRQLLRYAIDSATRAGCQIIQLMTDRQRPDAIRFYKSLGFTDSHFGMKLMPASDAPQDDKSLPDAQH